MRREEGEKRRGREEKRERREEGEKRERRDEERRKERRKCTETDGRYFVKAGNVLQYENHRKNGVVTVRMTRHKERSNTVLRSRQRLLH